MSHIITYTEEIEEHGYCQERPTLQTGEKYLHEVEGKKRLRIVKSVHFDNYVWDYVAQWTTIIEEYFEEEYVLRTLPMGQAEVPVYVANGMMGVLSQDKDLVCGELVVPSEIGNVVVRGVSAFDGCKGLPRFNTVFDRPFPGKYLIRSGKGFEDWENELYRLHFLERKE